MAAVLQVSGELLVSVAPEAAAATGSEWLAVGKAQGRYCDFGSPQKGKWISWEKEDKGE